MEIRLFGNVEIHDGTRTVPLVRAGERCVLACLALEPSRRFRVESLAERLWGDELPGGAGDTVASYVRTVRKAIEGAGGQREWLRNHRPAAYQLNIDPDLIDYHRFVALVAQARIRQRDRNAAGAVALYQQALRLRQGEALAGLTGQWAENCRYAIEQEYHLAACAMYEQQLAIGDHAAVARHAARFVLENVPTDRMIALTLRGLARSGQRAAIPDFLRRATERMWEQAQARPSPQIPALARQLMAGPRTAETLPGAAVLDPAPGRLGDGANQDVGIAAHPPESAGGGRVGMSADHNQQVFQAARDQYVTGA